MYPYHHLTDFPSGVLTFRPYINKRFSFEMTKKCIIVRLLPEEGKTIKFLRMTEFEIRVVFLFLISLTFISLSYGKENVRRILKTCREPCPHYNRKQQFARLISITNWEGTSDQVKFMGTGTMLNKIIPLSMSSMSNIFTERNFISYLVTFVTYIKAMEFIYP